MNNTKAKRARRRWRRVLKGTASVVLLGLIACGFVTYWTSSNDCERNAVTPTHPMKAILSCEYGVENLQLRDIEKPTPKENEVLVRVRAASVNPADGHLIRGVWLMRPMLGMRKPPVGSPPREFRERFQIQLYQPEVRYLHCETHQGRSECLTRSHAVGRGRARDQSNLQDE